MSRWVRVDWQTRRVWVMRRRCHHGLVGALLTAAAPRHPRLAILGIALAWHDRRDRHEWLPRHPEAT